MPALILDNVPAVIIEYKGRKKTGAAATEKFLELELNLAEHIEPLETLFPGLDMRLQSIASAEGGPEDMTCRSAIGDVSVTIKAVDKTTAVLALQTAKVKAKVKLLIGAKGDSIRCRFKCVGSLSPTVLPKVDDYTGADVFATIQTLQADIADKPAGGKPRNKGTRKTTIETADGGKADVETDKAAE